MDIYRASLLERAVNLEKVSAQETCGKMKRFSGVGHLRGRNWRRNVLEEADANVL
jgi:hypothetical protein